jgi:DNA-binding HxlR family transcriptional regulator
MASTLSEIRHLPGFDDTLFDEGCPTRVVLDHIGSKWGTLVLLVLSDGTLRWAELRRAVDGISEKMLAQTLRTLERDGLVRREALPVVPPHVEYSLTDLGRDLMARLIPLMEWLALHAPAIVGGERADAWTAAHHVGSRA